jgi:hypothetical protein
MVAWILAAFFLGLVSTLLGLAGAASMAFDVAIVIAFGGMAATMLFAALDYGRRV